MIGTLPKAFSQAATFQGCFPKWQLPKCAIAQAATSQVYPIRSLWRLRRPNLTFGKHNAWEVAIWIIVTWKVAIWEIITWDIVLWKLSNTY